MGTSWKRARGLGDGALAERPHVCVCGGGVGAHALNQGYRATGLVLGQRQRRNTELGLDTEAGIEKTKE